MSLSVYIQQPFISQVTNAGVITAFVGDGSSTTFDTVQDYTQVGAVCQYGTTESFLWTGGFTKNSDDSVTFDQVIPASLQGVIPSIRGIDLFAYDHIDAANGLSTTGYSTAWIGDIDDIYAYKYGPQSGKRGIEIVFVNNITSNALPTVSWVAAASCDVSGNFLSWTAPGSSLYTDKIAGFSTVAASSNSGRNTLLVASATGDDYFIPGDFLILNIGQPTVEIIQLASKSYNLLTFASSTNFPHYVGESVFTCLRAIGFRMIAASGFTSNTAQNYYNLSCKIKADQIQRS